jgi:hypothetical protein
MKKETDGDPAPRAALRRETNKGGIYPAPTQTTINVMGATLRIDAL